MGRKAWLVPGGAALGLACALLAGCGPVRTELADQESPEFDIARQRLFKLDNYLGKMNR